MNAARNIAIAILICFLLAAFALAKDPPVVTDDTISDQVRISLATDKMVGVLAFEVSVKSGVVTLTGAADQSGQRSRAEKVAKKVKGVKSVVNKITLKGAVGK